MVRRFGLGGVVSTFDPSTISGLKAWYKADALVLNDNDPVASWTDSSGSGNHATEATNKPLYKTGIVNSLPVVRFDGIDDRLRSGFVLADPHTVFTVGVWRNAYSASDRVMLDGVNGWDGAFYRQSSTTVHLYVGAVDAGLIVTTTPQSWHYYTAIFNGASSSLRVDGGTPGTGNPGTASPGGIHMARQGGGTEYSAVDVAEILIYNSALGATDRSNVESYLAAKYAL